MTRLGVSLLAALLLAGCARNPARPAGTGARDVVKSYFEGIVQRDWPRAHATLDPGSQATCNLEQFSLLAQNYRARLGFEPQAVQIRACDEQGADATAHVVLTGQTDGKPQRYKDAITLRRDNERWHIILPQHFGR